MSPAISFYTQLPAYEDATECSETSAYKIQTPGNYPKESIQQIWNCMEICPIEAELFHADRRTDGRA